MCKEIKLHNVKKLLFSTTPKFQIALKEMV